MIEISTRSPAEHREHVVRLALGVERRKPERLREPDATDALLAFELYTAPVARTLVMWARIREGGPPPIVLAHGLDSIMRLRSSL